MTLTIEAPAAAPLKGGLLDAAAVVTDARAMFGLSPDPVICGPLRTIADVDITAGVAKTLDDEFTAPIVVDPFLVYRGITTYLNAGDVESEVTAWWNARVTSGVEAGFQDAFNANATVLDAAEVTPQEGLALLEDWLGTVGSGSIHGSRGAITMLGSHVRGVPGALHTRQGTILVNGSGYDDTAPAGAPAGDRVLYAVSPLAVYRSGSIVVNVPVQATDTVPNFGFTNRQTVLVEETFAGVITCGVAAVVIGAGA